MNEIIRQKIVDSTMPDWAAFEALVGQVRTAR
jgi:hypothetical protein